MIDPNDAYQLISTVLATGDPFKILMGNGAEYAFSDYKQNQLTIDNFTPNIAVLNNNLNVDGSVYIDLTNVAGVSYGIYAQVAQGASNAAQRWRTYPSDHLGEVALAGEPYRVSSRGDDLAPTPKSNCCTLF